MTRIKTVPWSQADVRLRQARQAQHALYPPEYAEPVLPIDDDIAGIVASHSLIPDALHHAFATFGALMSPDLPLTRRQHEMIATVVSVTNGCYYCSTSHLEFLRRSRSTTRWSRRFGLTIERRRSTNATGWCSTMRRR